MLSPSLLIKQIEVYKSPIRLKKPFITSLGALEAAENIIVVIRTNGGHIGFGECSPFLTINGESMETCFIVASYLAKALLHNDPLNIMDCVLTMDRVIYGNASIKSAFDMALYDINAQHAGLPLYMFLNGNKHKKLITDYTVSIGEATQMADDARAIIANGFEIIKVKLGGKPTEDIERIHRIREAVGPSLPIRIDANQGWEVNTAIEVLNALAPYSIQHCEEPIPRWDFMNLSFVRKNSPIPIMADESCCNAHDAKRLIELQACDLLNVKLGKSGGIYEALKIVRFAEAHKIAMQVGGFLESRLGFTAAAHLSLASDYIIHCDFDTPLMFAEDHVEDGITYGKGGLIIVPELPGLGASVAERYLVSLEKSIYS